MKTVNAHEAKTHFSELLRRLCDGEEIIIANRDVPVARIVPLRESWSRILGKYKGQIKIADDFNAPLPAENQNVFQGMGQESEG